MVLNKSGSQYIYEVWMYCFISIYTNHYLSCNVLLRSDNKHVTYLLTYLLYDWYEIVPAAMLATDKQRNDFTFSMDYSQFN